jgi:DNA polymerase-3 subunit epsilon
MFKLLIFSKINFSVKIANLLVILQKIIIMNLKLERPLCFFDLETTSVNIKEAKIVEICLHKLSLDSTWTTLTLRINPGIPIPPEATAVHHITDADVANEAKFDEVAKEILDFIGDSDMGGFNSDKFDRFILENEFKQSAYSFKADDRNWLDVMTIFHKMEPRNLVAAYKFYCNRDLSDLAHSAEGDTKATAEIFMAQLEKYKGQAVPQTENLNFPNSEKVEDYAKFTAQFITALPEKFIFKNGEAFFNFSKHKGKSLQSVIRSEPSFIEWMLNNDFPDDVKSLLIKEKLKFKNSELF